MYLIVIRYENWAFQLAFLMKRYGVMRKMDVVHYQDCKSSLRLGYSGLVKDVREGENVLGHPQAE